MAHAATLALALLPWEGAQAQTQAWVPAKGHGSVAVAYQDLFISTHTLSDGSHGFPGSVSNHSVFLSFDYGLTDHLAMDVGLPYRSNKFDGPGKHNPGTLDDDHGETLIDDGRYHAGWQDWRVGLRYQWRVAPFKVTPFIAFGAPSHDYITFAHSALGSGQWHLQLGVNIGRQFGPPHQNLYFQAGYAYSFMEKFQERRVNHSTFNAEIGYFLSPRWTLSALLSAQKTHHGFDFPQDYPNQRDEHFFHHDQNLRNDFVNVGASASYQATPRYSALVTWGHTVWGENTHLIDHAVTVSVARSF